MKMKMMKIRITILIDFNRRVFLHFLGKAIAEVGIQNANVLIDSVLFYGIEVELHTRHEGYFKI